MAKKRLSIQTIKDILDKRLEHKFSKNQTALIVGCSPASVQKVTTIFTQTGYLWPMNPPLVDAELLNIIYPSTTKAAAQTAEPNWPELFVKFKHPESKIKDLWADYKSNSPNGYKQAHFSKLFADFRENLPRGFQSIYKDHRSGQKVFTAWAGVPVTVGTGVKQYVFVGVLGASGYAFAIAKDNQSITSWIDAHVAMFTAFGGAPELIFPCVWYNGDQDFNQNCNRMGDHYSSLFIPIRKGKRKIHKVVEPSLLDVCEHLNKEFGNLKFGYRGKLNDSLQKSIAKFNSKRIAALGKSRNQLFKLTDMPLLRRLPSEPYETSKRLYRRVREDCHIEHKGRYYSIPHQMVGHMIEAWVTDTELKIFHDGEKKLSHELLSQNGKIKYSTLAKHLPSPNDFSSPAHSSHLIKLAKQSCGQHTAKLFQHNMEASEYPQHAFKQCWAIINLKGKFSSLEIDTACSKLLAMKIKFYNRDHVARTILGQNPY